MKLEEESGCLLICGNKTLTVAEEEVEDDSKRGQQCRSSRHYTQRHSAAEKPGTSQTHLLQRLIKSLLHCLSPPQFMHLLIKELESHKYM